MKQLYKGAQLYGIYKAGIGAVIMTLICIFGGIFLFNIYNENKGYKEVNATITKPNCNIIDKVTEKEGTKTTEILYNCSLELKYTIDGKEYNNTLDINNSQKEYLNTNKIKIGFKPEDPENIKFDYKYTNMFALIGIVLLIVITISSYINLYIVLHSKEIAGIQGTIGFASNLRSAFTTKK